jgi:hypothetical protein
MVEGMSQRTGNQEEKKEEGDGMRNEKPTDRSIGPSPINTL